MKLWWVVVLVVAECGAQTGSDSAWVRSFGGRDDDRASVIRETAEGGFLLAGTTSDRFAGAALLVHTDSAGQVLWQRRIDEPRSPDVHDVQVLADGYIVTGTTRPGGDDVFPFLLRLDAAGQTQWLRVYDQSGQGGAQAVRALASGGFALAGWFTSPDATQMDARLLQTDSAGDLLWSRTFGGTDEEWAADLCVTAEGFALAVESAATDDQPGTVGLLRTDREGTLLGLRRQRTDLLGGVRALVAVPGGGFAIAWSRTDGSWFDDASAGVDCLDSAGELVWREVYPAAGLLESRLLLRPVDYGFLLSGYEVSLGSGPRTLHLLKIEPGGALRSARAFDGLGYVRWKKRRWYWQWEVAGAFGRGLAEHFHAVCLPPEALLAVYPDAPLPERSDRHLSLDSFSNVFQVRFTLAARQAVTVRLLDTAGRLVQQVACGSYPAGSHFEVIDGWALPAGIYILQIDTGERQLVQKLALVR